LYRRLGGPQSRSGRHGEVKILDPTGTRTPTSQSSSPYNKYVLTTYDILLITNSFRGVRTLELVANQLVKILPAFIDPINVFPNA
jgi:hypothetical protein